VAGKIVNICSNIAHTPCGRHSKRHDRQTGHQNDKHWGFSTFFYMYLHMKHVIHLYGQRFEPGQDTRWP